LTFRSYLEIHSILLDSVEFEVAKDQRFTLIIIRRKLVYVIRLLIGNKIVIKIVLYFDHKMKVYLY
jgi:hypothetical protein